jgi:hypothetical protein
MIRHVPQHHQNHALLAPSRLDPARAEQHTLPPDDRKDVIDLE